VDGLFLWLSRGGIASTGFGFVGAVWDNTNQVLPVPAEVVHPLRNHPLIMSLRTRKVSPVSLTP
jgi:hypothetical protein